MYQVVRVEKRKATAIGAMQFHNLRQFKTVAPNIDGEKSEGNVVLIECKDFASAINTRVGVIQLQPQQKRKIRKDCPRALEYVISASPEFFESATEEEKSDYFRKSLEYLKSRHGNENVISAVIHNDESTPHMHVVVVPVIKEKKIPTKDNPTGIVEKLNPKHFCDKFELQRLHSEFNECVGSVFGLERGEKSDRHHKSVAEYQREVARELAKEKAELAEFQDRDFTMPQVQIPPSELFESKAKYVERAVNSAIKQINPAFKTLKAKTITAQRKRDDLTKDLESTSAKLAEEQNKGETYKRIAEPLIELYEQIKANLNMTLTEFFNIVLDNTVQTFKEEIELAKNQEPSKTLSPNKRKGLDR